MNILSLFDGISTLMLALKKQNIKIEKYYASEIDKNAIKLSTYHFPEIIHLGDIRNWRNWKIDWGKINLIASGSPCQDLSIAGKRRGIYGDKSNLFFIFVDILNYIRKFNPNIKFLQENVASANKKDIAIISRELNVLPQLIDSALFTAQRRRRFYWSNISTKRIGIFNDLTTYFPLPIDKKILFKDIIENGFVYEKKAYTILTSAGRYKNGYKNLIKRYKKGLLNLVWLSKNEYRILTQNEYEKLQGFPEGYTEILNYQKAIELLGNAWTLPVIEYVLSFL